MQGEDRGPTGEVRDSGCTVFDGPNGDGVINDRVSYPSTLLMSMSPKGKRVRPEHQS